MKKPFILNQFSPLLCTVLMFFSLTHIANAQGSPPVNVKGTWKLKNKDVFVNITNHQDGSGKQGIKVDQLNAYGQVAGTPRYFYIYFYITPTEPNSYTEEKTGRKVTYTSDSTMSLTEGTNSTYYHRYNGVFQPVPKPNVNPVVYAGKDISITLPQNSTTLSGIANDPDGKIVSCQWGKIIGPPSHGFESPYQQQTIVNKLEQGVYTFELRVTDNQGAIVTDRVVVTVIPKQPETFLVDGNNMIEKKLTLITPQSNEIRFTLSSNPNVTWWKGIKVFNDSGKMLCLLETQDANHGPTSHKGVLHAINFESSIKVEFWKAKGLGVHTLVATKIFNFSELIRTEVSFLWMND